MKKSVFVCVVLLLSTSGHTECPTADLTGDCIVSLADLAVMASQWMAEGVRDIVFVDVPGGTFQMGDSFNEGDSDELPVHTVTLSPFKLSKYEVTNAQYAEYLNAANADGLIKVSDGVVYAASDDPNNQPYMDTHSPASRSQIDYVGGTFAVRDKSGRDMSNDPVVHVSWYGAKAFCDYYGYRLPTEAEWEYAARGGLAGQRFPWGNTIRHSQANYQSSSSYSYDVSPTRGYHPSWNDVNPYTAPVGSFAPNGYDLCDMTGNVWEWCNDWLDFDYYDNSPQDNPQGPLSGTGRVTRGGGWPHVALYCRTAYRVSGGAAFRSDFIGFRCALDFSDELQQAQFRRIETAIDRFVAESGYGMYPPSNDNSIPPVNPMDPTPYSGAQKLAEALIGWDMLGYHPESAFRSDGTNEDFTGTTYQVYAGTRQNLEERKGPFLEIYKGTAFQMGDIYEHVVAFNRPNLVLCDVYKKIRHSGKKTGMPILYFRARTEYFYQDSTIALPPAGPDGIDDDIYYYRDNMNLLALGAPDGGTPHILVGDDSPTDWLRFEQMILNYEITTLRYPYRADSYILISAGRDGVYGTADDVTNFDQL